MEYRCVINNTNIELQESINELIKKGWTPLGGVSISVETNGVGVVGGTVKYIYAQAMVYTP